MSDIHALSGAYAVDALDEQEREQFEQHLAQCPVCRAEVASLMEAAAMLPETTYAAPPPALRDRVLADIGKVRPLPPLREQEPVVRDIRSGRRRRFPVGLSAAAAVIAVVGAGVFATEPWQDDPPTTQISAADQVLSASDAERVTVKLDGAQATIVRSASEGRAVLVTEDMPAAPDGKVYQLWLQAPEGQMVPDKVMPAGSDLTVLLNGDATTAIGAGITVEPPGGSKVPTTTPIALFDFEQAV